MKTAGFVSVNMADVSQERSPTDISDHSGTRPPLLAGCRDFGLAWLCVSLSRGIELRVSSLCMMPKGTLPPNPRVCTCHLLR